MSDHQAYDVAEHVAGQLAGIGFPINFQEEGDDDVMEALRKVIFVPIPEGTIEIPDPLPERTLAWTIQYVEWQETFDYEPFIRLGLEYGKVEIQLDDQTANGWSVFEYCDDVGCTHGETASEAFHAAFGEDAAFNLDQLRLLSLHLKDVGYQGMKQLWNGKQILLENVEEI